MYIIKIAIWNLFIELPDKLIIYPLNKILCVTVLLKISNIKFCLKDMNILPQDFLKFIHVLLTITTFTSGVEVVR